MSFLIPQAALDALVCNFCHKYLSVTPVKVFPNRRMKCGRCVSQTDKGGAISIYNKVAKKSIFKCINHYEGCKSMLNTTEVVEHEATCKSKEYVCPICSDLIQSYLVYNHFTNKHKELVLKEPQFLVNQSRNTDQYFLYRYENHLLFIKYSPEIVSNDAFTRVLFNYSLIGDSNTVRTLNLNITLTFGKTTIKKKVNCGVFPSDGGNDLTLKLDLKENILVVGFLLEVPMVVVTVPKSNVFIQKAVVANVATNTEEWSQLNIAYLSGLLLSRYFTARDIYLDDLVKNKLKDGGILREHNNRNRGINRMNRETIFKMTDIRLTCFLCSLPKFCRVKGEILFVKKFEKYYLICDFCSKTQNWPDLYVGASYLENVSLYCKWMCGSHKPYYEIEQHEIKCENQISQPCPLELCEQRYKSFEIGRHIRDKHPNVAVRLVYSKEHNLVYLYPFYPTTHILFVVSNISVAIKFTLHEGNLWEIVLTCKILNAHPRLIILNERGEFLAFIKERGSVISNGERVQYTCYLADPGKEEFEKLIK